MAQSPSWSYLPLSDVNRRHTLQRLPVRALPDSHAISYSVTWVEHDLIAWRKAGEHLCVSRAPVADLNARALCASISDGKYGPFVTFSKKGAERHRKCIVGLPDSDVDDYAEVMSKPRPDFRRVDKIDRDADPLLLYP